MYTLGTAAKATGMAKSTIHRAIKRGIISARPTLDGRGYEIDPAELHRVYPPVSPPGPPAEPLNGSTQSSLERSATPSLNSSNTALEIKLARAEAELAALRQVFEVERRRAEELRVERDKWCAQAECLALAPPARRAWWRWRQSA